MEFKSWRDIKEWAEKNGWHNLATRLQLNNDYWWSCGEFGRSQVRICDDIRYADYPEEVAEAIDQALADDDFTQVALKKKAHNLEQELC